MKFDFHPEAQKEYASAANWYAEKSKRTGEKFVAAIETAVAVVIEDPKQFQLLEGDLRIYRLTKFPYRLIYAFDEIEQQVIFYVVMHEKRRPGYWKERVRR